MTWHYWGPAHYAPWPDKVKSLNDLMTRNPTTCTFRPPKGEAFETWLHRTAPIIRDALGIPPAPDMSPMDWHALKQRTAPADGAAPAAESSRNSGGRRR